jgi:hypothetical protein
MREKGKRGLRDEEFAGKRSQIAKHGIEQLKRLPISAKLVQLLFSCHRSSSSMIPGGPFVAAPVFQCSELVFP